MCDYLRSSNLLVCLPDIFLQKIVRIHSRRRATKIRQISNLRHRSYWNTSQRQWANEIKGAIRSNINLV